MISFFFSLTLFLVISLVPLWLIPQLTSDPVDRSCHIRPNHAQQKTEFTLSDFMGLFFLLGIELAIGRRLLVGDDYAYPATYAAVIGIFAVIVIGVWYASVVALSQARLRVQLHRSLVSLVAAPLIWFGTFGMVIGLFATISTISFGTRVLWRFPLLLVGSITVLVGARLYLCWAFTKYGCKCAKELGEPANGNWKMTKAS